MIPIYTQAEAARKLGISRERVRQLVAAGQLRLVPTAGGGLVLRAEDVEARAQAMADQSFTRGDKKTQQNTDKGG